MSAFSISTPITSKQGIGKPLFDKQGINPQHIGHQQTATVTGPVVSGSIARVLAESARTLVYRLSQIYDIYGERRQMRNLTDEVLKDLGITRAQLNAECSRSLTDIPANRKQRR